MVQILILPIEFRQERTRNALTRVRGAGVTLFLQLLCQPFVGGELLVAAATGSRGLRGFAGQLLQPVHLGLERVEGEAGSNRDTRTN